VADDQRRQLTGGSVDEDTDLSCDVGACDRLVADGTYLLVTYRQADGAFVTVKLETFASC